MWLWRVLAVSAQDWGRHREPRRLTGLQVPQRETASCRVSPGLGTPSTDPPFLQGGFQGQLT